MKKWLLLFGFSPVLQALEPESRTLPINGMDKPMLGQILFFDKALSFHGNQNCATCHNQNQAFIDDRQTSAEGMVSQGDDLTKFGRRNSPTILYAKFSPDFHFDDATQEYVGGQFWDGRAVNLATQAGMPPIDPLEMGMPSKLEVAKRLYSNNMYYSLFTDLYSEKVWQSYEYVYAAMENAIETFQKEKRLLAPFDSNYDKFLQGTYDLSELEKQGMVLFFDKNRTNCSLCHQLHDQNYQQETFTNYRYYNLGLPKNQKLISHNQYDEDFIDLGLFENPLVKGDEKQKGKFKPPTLRNVAVTAPYMHNGIFQELRTVLLFLDSYNNPIRKINPETQQPWGEAEYATTMAHDKLKSPALTDNEIDALEAFLKTLTDERYQRLLKP